MRTCLAIGCGKMICIYRLRDNTYFTIKLPSLITTFQWRSNEAETESPILVVSHCYYECCYDNCCLDTVAKLHFICVGWSGRWYISYCNSSQDCCQFTS